MRCSTLLDSKSCLNVVFFLYWRLCFFWVSGPVEGFYLLYIYIKGCTQSMLFSVSFFFFTMVQKAGAAGECLGSFE